MRARYDHIIIALVVALVLMTNAWCLFSKDIIGFPYSNIELTQQWYVQLLTYRFQTLFLFISLYLLSTRKLLTSIILTGIVFQLAYIVDFILTYNHYTIILLLFVVIVLFSIITLTKWTSN